MKKIKQYAAVITIAFICSCGTINKAGKSLGEGLKSQTKEMGQNFVAGAQGQLPDSVFRENLKKLLNDVISSAGANASSAISKLKDSLMDNQWNEFVRKLADEITGDKTGSNIKALMENINGEASRKKFKLLIEEMRNGLLNESTYGSIARIREELLGVQSKENIGHLRDELLNIKTKAAVAGIVDSAMLQIAYRMKNDVSPAIQENASFFKKYADKILMTVGGIALAIIGLVWRNRQKYLKLATVLTSQINNIPDKNSYDELTKRIKSRAIDNGVEQTLRKILSENGMLGELSKK